MLVNRIKISYEEATNRNFDVLYHYFDIHNTILLPDYDHTGKSELIFFPWAKETLQLLTKNCNKVSPKLVLGLYTCSHEHEIERYQKFFKENNIEFKYVNENPEVKNTRLGNFDKKLYFSVLYEDKSGFDPLIEWEFIYNFFLEKFK